MGDESNQSAMKALQGIEQYLRAGMWPDVEEQKIVVFRGQHEHSSCYVTNDEGSPREGASARGTGTKEIHVLEGESVYAIEGYVRFKSITE